MGAAAILRRRAFSLANTTSSPSTPTACSKPAASSGELYSFDRLKTLFSGRPTADQAAQAAVNFGQEDDITVLTLTRLKSGEEATALHSGALPTLA